MTIKDLSAMTGYSVGTVSRVLNHQPNVSPKAREAILAAAEASGFQLNLNAKQLKQQSSKSILAVVKGTANLIFVQLVESLQADMANTAYTLVVEYVDEDRNEVRHAVQMCTEKKPRGVLFLGGNRENFQRDLGKIDVPCVLVTGDASSSGLDNLCSVTSDDRQAAYMAIDALCNLGHRQVAIISGDIEVSDTSAKRYEGCLRAFRDHGVEFDPEQQLETSRFSYDGGYGAVKRLMERGSRFTALFAISDVMAIGAIRALQDRGLRVPEDVSVMGFDGMQIGEYTSPRLATVRQDTHQIAYESVKLLLENIAQRQPPRFITVPVSVELRESVRKL